MEQLPKWIIPNLQPTFYDAESLTTIEMTGKIYGVVRTLIEEHNKFIEDIKKTIEDFESDTTKDICCFKSSITCILENYIKSIDHKIDTQDNSISEAFKNQDAVIADAVNYMKTNIAYTASMIINQAIAEGRIVASLTYNPETEELSMNVGGEV